MSNGVLADSVARDPGETLGSAVKRKLVHLERPSLSKNLKKWKQKELVKEILSDSNWTCGIVGLYQIQDFVFVNLQLYEL